MNTHRKSHTVIVKIIRNNENYINLSLLKYQNMYDYLQKYCNHTTPQYKEYITYEISNIFLRHDI